MACRVQGGPPEQGHPLRTVPRVRENPDFPPRISPRRDLTGGLRENGRTSRAPSIASLLGGGGLRVVRGPFEVVEDAIQRAALPQGPPHNLPPELGPKSPICSVTEPPSCEHTPHGMRANPQIATLTGNSPSPPKTPALIDSVGKPHHLMGRGILLQPSGFFYRRGIPLQSPEPGPDSSGT